MEKSEWISHSTSANNGYSPNNNERSDCHSNRLLCCVLLEIVRITQSILQPFNIHYFLSVFFFSVLPPCPIHRYTYCNSERLFIISYASNYTDPIYMVPSKGRNSRTVTYLLQRMQQTYDNRKSEEITWFWYAKRRTIMTDNSRSL